ncbi:MAG: hypothetical protein GJV46_06020 [Geobacter sp.]|nr:hypothetical protein [Geobacter sp.]
MNAGQMFMSMAPGALQPVATDAPASAVPLTGEQNNPKAVFATLLSEIRFQANEAKASGADKNRVPPQAEVAEQLPLVSIANSSAEGLELLKPETRRLPVVSQSENESAKLEPDVSGEPGKDDSLAGTPIYMENSSTAAQLILAAYAQPGRTTPVSVQSSHGADAVQNVQVAANPEQSAFAADTVLRPPVVEQNPLSAVEVTAKPEAAILTEQIPADDSRLTPETPVQNLSAARQHVGRTPMVNISPGHEVDAVQNVPMTAKLEQPAITADQQPARVEAAPAPKLDRDVLQAAEEETATQATPATRETETIRVSVASPAKTASVEVVIKPETSIQNLTEPRQQDGRTPMVNISPSHEVDAVQNVPMTAKMEQPAITADQQPARVGAAPAPKLDRDVLQAAEEETATQATPATRETETIRVSVASPAKSASVEVAVKPETPIQNLAEPRQQDGRTPMVNISPGREVDAVQNVPMTAKMEQPAITADQQPARVEAAPAPKLDKPVLQAAERSYRFAARAPEQLTVQQPTVPVVERETAAQVIQAVNVTETTQVAVEAVVKTTPEEVAVKTETANLTELIPSANSSPSKAPVQILSVPHQQSNMTPVDNTPVGHKIDSAVSMATAKANPAESQPVISSAPVNVRIEVEPEQTAVQQVSGQSVHPAPLNKGNVQSEAGSNEVASKPVSQVANHSESVASAFPESWLSSQATSESSKPEAGVEFSLPRPIAVSKANLTESGRMQQTTTALRPQIITLDIDRVPNNSEELGMASALKSEETSSAPVAQLRDSGKKTEIALPSGQVSLGQKVNQNATTAGIQPAILAVQTEEVGLLKKVNSGVNTAPVQQSGNGVAIQAVQDAQSENAKTVSSQADAKEIAVAQQKMAASGEMPSTSDDLLNDGEEQAGSGQKSDSQVINHQVHAQSKSEHQALGTVASSKVDADQLRQTLPEQVAHQVRERLTQHEVKPGNQQITLTLSPGNLGELKMNLNLQGQKLSVEIVTESRTVRDSIMQHYDSLKECLARQNITVESFDVTSHGNSSGNPGNSQDAWRELARQKQQQLWMSTGSYHFPPVNVASSALASQAANEHGMLDIHY